jgi:predicted Zn-dependent protease
LLLSATPAAADPLMDVVAAELDRIKTALEDQPSPPYWMAVEVIDVDQIEIQAAHGAAGPIARHRTRTADIDIRVGSPELDNTHQIRDGGWFSQAHRRTVELPLDEVAPEVVRRLLWAEIDETYRSATRQLIKVKNNAVIKVEAQDTSADFSAAPVIKDIREIPELVLDEESWLETVRALSGALLAHPGVHDTNARITAQRVVRRYVNTEGTRIRFPETRYRVMVWAGTTADDGMNLSLTDYVDARSVGALPDRAALDAMTTAIGQRLTELRSAPMVDPYVGPAILRGRAAAVFFHEVLGHRVEGHRQKDDDEGQTFTEKVGEQVLPTFLSVIDDPTVQRIGTVDLSGAYPYDNQGVASEPVVVVQDGILKNFLMSRSPIEGFAASNGHGRRQSGKAVVARQGNLIVRASKAVSPAALEAKLLDEIRRQKKPYGYIFDDITGGFTFTGRVSPNSFKVKPVTVWRVYADGRPHELVRGVDLIGTPLTAFQRIVAASSRVQVFNGTCGAESGWVPVSAAAPDLLVQELEIQRSEKAHDRPPILPAPEASP